MVAHPSPRRRPSTMRFTRKRHRQPATRMDTDTDQASHTRCSDQQSRPQAAPASPGSEGRDSWASSSMPTSPCNSATTGGSPSSRRSPARSSFAYTLRDQAQFTPHTRPPHHLHRAHIRIDRPLLHRRAVAVVDVDVVDQTPPALTSTAHPSHHHPLGRTASSPGVHLCALRPKVIP